jgi:opacity protein-like surface antigen
MRRPGILAAAALLSACLGVRPLLGQDTTRAPGDGAPQDSEWVQPPRMPDAPRQFKLAAALSTQSWGNAAGRGEVDDSWLYGLDVERILIDFLSIRLSGAYGRGSIASASGNIDFNQYVIDLALLGRLAFEPLISAGVIPYVGVLGGSMVHDPVEGDLRTRSQTALGFGAGAEVRLTDRLGLHADWRHLFVELEDILSAESREAVQVEVERASVGLFWRF